MEKISLTVHEVKLVDRFGQLEISRVTSVGLHLGVDLAVVRL
jgi:hypothetical protein